MRHVRSGSGYTASDTTPSSSLRFCWRDEYPWIQTSVWEDNSAKYLVHPSKRSSISCSSRSRTTGGRLIMNMGFSRRHTNRGAECVGVEGLLASFLPIETLSTGDLIYRSNLSPSPQVLQFTISSSPLPQFTSLHLYLLILSGISGGVRF